jgi:nodulation protein F
MAVSASIGKINVATAQRGVEPVIGTERQTGSVARNTEVGEGRGMADQLATEIIEKIKAHAENNGAEITTATELNTLGIHSLELTEIIFDLEEKYGIEIEMNTVEAWSSLKNVGDIVSAVRKLIAKKA